MSGNNPGEWDILHCFADTGVECEVLSAYGDTTRVGIDPVDNQYTTELITADARSVSFDRQFDLGLFHPPCQKWAVGSYIHNSNDNHDNMIPLARDLAHEYCNEWIIENVPLAPLNDPVVLNGGMFGKSLHYERAFETSYHVPQPRRQTRLVEPKRKIQKHHNEGGFTGSYELWKNMKGYSGNYPSRTLKRCAIPRNYIEYLIEPLL